ncbi:MAG: tRNA(Ile)-lysidine synthase [Bacteroidetes bacterium]|nr:tRNA(Ile)-lysidine synthase [Bacteroidota bacterium]
MLQAFVNNLKKEQLIAPGDTVLLAVSGGIDSVVMCELFHKAGISFSIAHCNFQLRGKESEGDEAFVKKLAAAYNVPFHSIRFKTNAFAKKNKLSIQVAARNLRYEWFEQLREASGSASIATAHHADDSVETFLINLVRGTGIAGLHGILPKQGKIIRPMLFCNKEAISDFAKKNKLKFRSDSSNDSDKYLRNRIRKSILPALKKLNPSIDTAILKNIEHLSGVEQIFRREILRTKKEILRVKNSTVYISISGLKELDPLPAYLFELLKPYGFNAASIEEIIHSLGTISGKQFTSATHRLIRDRKDLIIQPKEQLAAESASFTVKKNQRSAEGEGIRLSFSQLPAGTNFSRSEMSASLDLDTLSFPLTIRKWREGDSFQPIGMKGKKKLSDFFIDRKLSIAQKEDTWLLVSGGEIAWVIGQRIDDRFKVSAQTKKIYFAELTE